MFSSKTLALVSLLVPFTFAQNYGGGGSATTPTPAAAAAAASSSTAATSATNTQTIMAAATGILDLTFKPNSVVAAPGTFVEFHFGAANHSLAESSLANPCSPANTSSIFAGFNFIVPGTTGTSTSVFTLMINSTDPIWFYCPQVIPAAHCPLGMAGVINPPSSTTGDQFVAAAKKTNGTIIPLTVQGGLIGKAGAAPSGTSAAPSASPTSSATHITVGMGLMGLVSIAFSALLSF